MKKIDLIGSTAAGTLAAASGAPQLAVVPDTGPKFEAPEPPPEGADLLTVHSHMAEVMRRVVAIDDAAFSDLFNRGEIMPPETRATTEAMRRAVLMYDVAAASARGASIPRLLGQALAEQEAIISQVTDENALVALTSVHGLVATARLAYDFQPPVLAPDAVEAHIVWNEGRNEGVIFIDDEDSVKIGCPALGDAHQASTGDRTNPLGSALAEAFYGLYDDDAERPIQTILVVPPPGAEE